MHNEVIVYSINYFKNSLNSIIGDKQHDFKRIDTSQRIYMNGKTA